jgi:hypothetical protein
VTTQGIISDEEEENAQFRVTNAYVEAFRREVEEVEKRGDDLLRLLLWQNEKRLVGSGT